MFKHILIATDGSDRSLRAADTGLALAARLGARVYGFHAAMPFPAVAYFAEMLLASQARYTEEAEARAERYLADLRQRAEAAGVPFDGGFQFDGHPHEAIIAAALEHHCDLIVMAPHGRHGIERSLLGSETHRTILHGDLPVLVCP